jgi:DNA invertase Pin-like site-specific DNA recombinase
VVSLPEPLRAAIYGRISKREEKSILDNMMDEARNHAAKQGYVVVKEYVDVESGGGDLPDLNKLKHDATVGHWDVLIFKSPSRLTRKGVESAFHLMRLLSENNKSWHCMQYPVLSSDDRTPKVVRDIMLAVLSALDEDYRLNISLRTKAVLAKKRSEGVRLGRHGRGCLCPKHRTESMALIEKIHEQRVTKAMTWEEVGAAMQMKPRNVRRILHDAEKEGLVGAGPAD